MIGKRGRRWRAICKWGAREEEKEKAEKRMRGYVSLNHAWSVEGLSRKLKRYSVFSWSFFGEALTSRMWDTVVEKRTTAGNQAKA